MRSDRFEELLGQVLESQAGVDARPGLEGRVLARVRVDGVRAGHWGSVVRWSAGTAVALATMCLVRGWDGRGARESGEARHGIAEQRRVAMEEAYAESVAPVRLGAVAEEQPVTKRLGVAQDHGRRAVRHADGRKDALAIGALETVQLRMDALEVAPLRE